MHGQQTGQLGADRHLPPLAALAVLDGDHPFVQADVLDAQRHEFRNARPGFQQGLDHEANLAVPGVGRIDEPELLLNRRAGRSGAPLFRRLQARFPTGGHEDGLGVDMVDALPQHDVGDLAGDAFDAAVHGLSCGISEYKPGCGLPRSVV